MSPISYGGSGITPFRNKIDVAYVASYLDCLFDKGISFNGILPMGTKPLSLMHGVFEPLRQKRTELPKDVIVPEGNIDDRLNTWFENFKLIEFDARY